MIGIVIMLVVFFLTVIILGNQLSDKSDKVENLQAELDSTRKRADADSLDLDKMYRVIQEEGYFPIMNDEGEVTFKIQGTTFVVGIRRDFAYTRIYYSRADPDDIDTAIQAANLVSQMFIAVKVLVNRENCVLVFSVESYCTEVRTYRKFFQRSLSILYSAAEKFWEKFEEFTNEHQPQQQSAEEQPAVVQGTRMLS